MKLWLTSATVNGPSLCGLLRRSRGEVTDDAIVMNMLGNFQEVDEDCNCNFEDPCETSSIREVLDAIDRLSFGTRSIGRL